MKQVIKHAFYPAMLALNLGVMALSLQRGWDPKDTFRGLGAFNVATMLVVEWRFPLRQDWALTRSGFIRDVKWTLLSLATIGLVRGFFLGIASDNTRGTPAWLEAVPVPVEALAMALTFEFFQYWTHRFSHEGTGRLGTWMWKVHAAHHLPKDVNLLMHPVFHPLNTLLVQVLLQGSFAVLGFRPQAIFMFYGLLGLHELFSHFNVDIAAGPLNRVFIGTELHRQHHSANAAEALNYGTFLSIWDTVFGTYALRSNGPPEALGVTEETAYPPSGHVWDVLKLPFRAAPSSGELRAKDAPFHA